MNRSSLLKSSALLSATALAANGAHAEVIYSGVVNLTATGETPVAFDLDADTQDDYKFFFHINNANKPVLESFDYFEGNGTNLIFAANTERGLTPTAGGTLIDGSFLGGTSQAYTETFFWENINGPTVVGEWDNGSGPVTGYVGFAIPRGGENYSFGWGQMTFDQTNKTLTLIDYAYETELNTGIVTPVPEPATISALAAGTLALLLVHRRKRRVS